jgi:hypothetical protein
MRRSGCGIAVGVVGTLVLIVGGLAFRRQLGPTTLAEEIAAAKREGVPVEPVDFVAPEVAESQNAERPYLAAARRTKAIANYWTWRERLAEFDARKPGAPPWSKYDRSRLTAILKPLFPAIESLREAGRRETLVVHRAWDAGPGLEWSDVPLVGVAIQGTVMRARLRNAEGDFAGARDDLLVAARGAALWSHGVLFDEFLNRRNAEERILSAVRDVVVSRPRHRDSVTLVREVSAALGSPTEIRSAIAAEPWLSRLTIRHLPFAEVPDYPYAALRLPSVRTANEANQIAYWRALFRLLPRDSFAFREAKRAAETTTNRFDREHGLHTLASLVRLEVSSVDAFAAFEARRRVALAAADVLEAWQRDHRLPESLPHPLEDPFGTQLRYRPEKTGFTVYSLGPDRRDDGGLPDKRDREPDIAWRITLPTA